MSYILDALKKAEAERQIGGVPSIHATAPGTSAAADDRSFPRRHLPWIIIGLLLAVMLAYVLWSHPWSPAPAQPVPTVASEPPVQPESVPSAPVLLAPAQTAPLQQASATPAPATAPVTEKPIHPAPAAVAAIAKPKADDAKPAVLAPEASAASTPVAEVEAGTMQDLPANIQRELPPVTVNGYIYARNPADRSALINKKLLHEGDNIAPDLVLEKLTPKGAVLNFKGYRYRISF